MLVQFFRLLVRYIINSVVSLAVLGALLSLGSLFSRYHLWFDLLSHFRVQYIVLLLPAFLLAAYSRKIFSVLIISFTLAVHGFAVGKSMLPVTNKNDSAYAELSVLNSNVLYSNFNFQAQLDIIADKDPDLIAFLEYSPDWHYMMRKNLPKYPHRITAPEKGSFGIAIYSKHPIKDGGVEHFTVGGFPAITADIQMREFSFRVIAVHPPPPAKARHYHSRNRYMKTIALESKAHDGAVLVTGDFNATPWTSHFSDMLKTGGLRNTRGGHGFHPTWPTPIFALRVPIDHILVSEHFAVDHFESIHLKGSDHRNVFSKLRIYENEVENVARKNSLFPCHTLTGNYCNPLQY